MRATTLEVPDLCAERLAAQGLSRPINLARSAGRLRKLELGERDVSVPRSIVESRPTGQMLARGALYAEFDAAGQAPGQLRGVHLLFCLSQAGVLCQVGEQYELVAERGPSRSVPARDEALGALAKRSVAAHAPVEANELAFRAGIGKRDAKRALDIAGPVQAVPVPIPPALFLPGYDEYFLGYRGRAFCVDPRHAGRVVPGGNGIYAPMVVLDGLIRGTWKRVDVGGISKLVVQPFERLGSEDHTALLQAAAA